jgi:hypothetical protein
MLQFSHLIWNLPKICALLGWASPEFNWIPIVASFYILVILSELLVKYVIGFGRFVKILDDQWKC